MKRTSSTSGVGESLSSSITITGSTVSMVLAKIHVRAITSKKRIHVRMATKVLFTVDASESVLS